MYIAASDSSRFYLVECIRWHRTTLKYILRISYVQKQQNHAIAAFRDVKNAVLNSTRSIVRCNRTKAIQFIRFACLQPKEHIYRRFLLITVQQYNHGQLRHVQSFTVN